MLVSSTPAKEFDECAGYIENEQGVGHVLQPRRTALHLVRVLRPIYKFRSQRGAVHISPTYGPNHMDARLMIESVRWAMNETLRVFWHGADREAAAKAIRESVVLQSITRLRNRPITISHFSLIASIL